MSIGHVVVIGAGPVGLSAALLLDRADIACTVLERDLEPSGHPKARGIRTRTMELLTQWGIADKFIGDALPREANRFIYCDSLAGEEIARSPQAESGQRASFASECRVAQSTVNSVLDEHVASLPLVTYRRGFAVKSVKNEPNHVVVYLESGQMIEADYVIAADGVGSTTRANLDIPLDGEPLLGYGHSIYWHADLQKWTRDRPCIQFIIGDRTGHPASIASVDGRFRWVTMLMQPPRKERPEPPSLQEIPEILRTAVGADIDPDIIDVKTWRLSAQVARTWRAGRVFLAGDAAHSFPPTGGFGMNTGIQDVHNLVWKLRLVLTGAARQTLLDSYELERKDIARSNADWSKANGDRFRDIRIAIAAGNTDEMIRLLGEQQAHVDPTDQDLGFGYRKGAFVGEAVPAASPLTTALPGHRFPECPIVIGERTSSSVLAFADDFYIAARNVRVWQPAAETVAKQSGIAIKAVQIGTYRQGQDPLAGQDAALVRPDGITAWVGNIGAARPEGLLESVLSLGT